MRIFTYIIILLLFTSGHVYAQEQSAPVNLEAKEIVVLLHGLARSNIAMWRLKMRLEDAGYHVEQVGYRSLTQTPAEIVQDISAQIDRCCQSINHKVHFVGHSLGGLLIRAYLENNPMENLGRVVLMGTPNQGTAVADYFRDKWWAQFVGPTALALGTGEDSFPNSLSDPDYPVGVIAGFIDNDLNDELLPGSDDGLVSIDSTRLKGMGDFIVVRSQHTMMRYNEEVASQTIAYLKNGQFNHSSDQ